MTWYIQNIFISGNQFFKTFLSCFNSHFHKPWSRVSHMYRTSQCGPVTFQMLSSHMQPVAIILDSAGVRPF